MEPHIDRRAIATPRLPVDLLVELSHEGDEDVYEADAIDLARGGIGLRAAVLPEVGQRLRCRFEVPGELEACEAQGEVVWAHDAGRWSGAFGVRFDDMDLRTADVLERIAPMPAEDPGTPPELRAPRSVRVRLDGVGSAIEGEVVSDGEVISIEQAMPFLQIGRGAEIAGEGMRERAVLERVRLRVEDGVPRLVLELARERAMNEDEIATSDATLQDEPLEELVARGPGRAETAREGISRDEVMPASARREAARAEADAPRTKPVRSEPSMLVESQELREIAPARRAAAKVATRETPRVVTREEAGVDDGGGELEGDRPEPTLARKMRELGDKIRPQVSKAWMATRALGVVIAMRSGPLALRARDAIVAGWRALMALVVARAPKLGAMLGGAPKRRTTATPPQQVAAAPRRARNAQPAPEPLPNKRNRAIAIGAIALTAVTLSAYGLASGEDAPAEVEVHREVGEGGSWAATAATVVTTPEGVSATPSVITVPETLEPIAVPDAAGGLPPLEPRAMPEPAAAEGRIPAPSYPSLADRTATATAPAALPPVAEEMPAPAVVAMEFGAAAVERGRTTTLRMSAPIQSLEGLADGSGFTVTVRGSLSLDRASPISASNPSVERAAILNRGDFCVLTIRFVEGRSPQYRVVARGTSLDVTIGR